jgi:hypothetical protein
LEIVAEGRKIGEMVWWHGYLSTCDEKKENVTHTHFGEIAI